MREGRVVTRNRTSSDVEIRKGCAWVYKEQKWGEKGYFGFG